MPLSNKMSNSVLEEDGSNIVYHEMTDVDSDGATDGGSTTILDNLDRHVGFWPNSHKYQKFTLFGGNVPGFRGKFSCREVVLLCISVLLALILAIFMAVTLPNGGKAPIDTLCTTRACVVVAGTVADTIDETVEPCDDFYEFACGGWKKKNPLPSGHSYWDSFAVQKRSIETTLKNILEKEIMNNTLESSERKVKQMYNSCLDLESINALGARPIKELISEFGGWSITDGWDEKNFDFNQLIKKTRHLGLNTFFSIGVTTDLKNVSNNIIRIEDGALDLGKRNYYINKTLDDEILGAYLTYMTDICVLLGGEKTHSIKKMEDVIRLEQRLAEIQMPVEKTRHLDENYDHISIQDLQKISPMFPWMDIVNDSFSSVLSEETIQPTEVIGTSSVEYLRNLTEIIHTTSNETLNNFVIWQLVSMHIPGLGEDFLDSRAKLNKKIFGSDSSCIERWRWCVSAMDNALGLALGKLFVEDYFDESSREMARTMVREIKDAFKRNLPQTSWLDKATEEKAIKKVDAVRDMIGYPDYILNQTRVNEEYEEWNLTIAMSYFEMIVSFHKFSFDEMLRELRKPVDKEDWDMTPPTINAYYKPTENLIVFPAGILQPPAYSSAFPQSINFGGIGLVVGHELTHGFDDEGRKYGIDGNLHDWWKEETVKKFQEKAECIVDQYSAYTIEGQNVNGNLTIGENIADNGGLRLAYGAYKKWRETGKSSEDPLLPSLPYSHEQLFFISFAQLWCSTSTAKHMRESTLLGMHSPNKIRVNGVASNFPEFSDAFRCPAGSKMNPEKKCRVW